HHRKARRLVSGDFAKLGSLFQSFLSEYPLWIANWDVSEPKVPASWEVAGKSWSIWQHSNKGRIAGIEVDVDLNWVRT
ncbi:GH25 family lysozyme, partial [Pseudomonas amygdali]|uniref:GH25 family lysozyme n=1 Tax=Pseudomonas amygdali TaxID=47877 RepID=UPI002286BC1C